MKTVDRKAFTNVFCTGCKHSVTVFLTEQQFESGEAACPICKTKIIFIPIKLASPQRKTWWDIFKEWLSR
jgi:ribosomal protein S27E